MCNNAAAAEEQPTGCIVNHSATAGATDINSAKLDYLTRQIFLKSLAMNYPDSPTSTGNWATAELKLSCKAI